jgi:DNA-binding CsgD family transcriptional regulator
VLAASACAETTPEGRQARLGEGLACAEACAERWVLEWCYRSAASIAQWFREPERSIELATAGIAIGDPQNTWHRARLQAIRGQARMQLGDFAAARNELRAAIAGFRETQETWTLLPVVLHFGMAAAIEGEWREATESFIEAARRALAGTEMQGLAHAAGGLGVCLAHAGKDVPAREAFAVYTAAVEMPGFPLTVPARWAELLAAKREAMGKGMGGPVAAPIGEAVKRAIEAAEAILAAGGETAGRSVINPSGLSQRELEVLRLIALGKSNKEIGDQLFLSVRTVEKHVANIYGKAAINGRAEATLLATRMGLVQ